MTRAKLKKVAAVAPNLADMTDPVAALRALAFFCEQNTEPFDGEQAYGLGVILTMIADRVEGGTA